MRQIGASVNLCTNRGFRWHSWNPAPSHTVRGVIGHSVEGLEDGEEVCVEGVAGVGGGGRDAVGVPV